MVSNQSFVNTECYEFKRSDCGKQNVSDTDSDGRIDRGCYNYDEAIALAGNGCYNISLLLTTSLAILAMSLDMFSFSVIVALSSCEFHLDLRQQSILMSMPFLGPVAMAYFWGYMSDTRGRKKILTIAMAVSFLMASLCAIATHWIALAILKLIGTCFCSCAQSVSFALLGESCGGHVKGMYMIGMSGVINLALGLYFAISYAVVSLDFYFVIPGFITLLPWRLIALIMAVPLGLSALCLLFFYESPKFLLNAGRHDEALELLKKICKRNGLDPKIYPVKKIILTEVGNVRLKEESLLRSMWNQTVPLFKPPLLKNTLILYYLIIIVYVSSNSLIVWLPFLSKPFTEGLRSSDTANGLCGLISQTSKTNMSDINDTNSCNSSVDLPLVVITSITSVVKYILNILISTVSSRKKSICIILLMISGASCVGTINVPHNITDIVLYFGAFLDNSLIGVMFSYCVDLYPTSFRGMSSCLGVMVARLSSVAGVNFVGPYIMTNCSITFYSLAALIFSGIIAAYFLPPDRPNKVVQ